MTDLLGKRAREIVDEAVDKAPNANQFIARSSAIGAVRHAVEEERERCAQIALAIDSGRGNEKEIAHAIRNPK